MLATWSPDAITALVVAIAGALGALAALVKAFQNSGRTEGLADRVDGLRTTAIAHDNQLSTISAAVGEAKGKADGLAAAVASAPQGPAAQSQGTVAAPQALRGLTGGPDQTPTQKGFTAPPPSGFKGSP